MGIIRDKLNYLAETKNQMKTALKSKGQDIKDNDSFRSYVGKINNLSPTPTGTINISQNGTYDVSSYANADVDVAGEPTLQSKSVTITENGTQTITPDIGYDGLDEVEITTNVPQLDTSDATATAGDIKLNKTAYVDGVKVTGTYDTSSTPPKIVDGMRLNKSRSIPSNLDISQITDMSFMFDGSTFSNFPVLDTSHITDMRYTWQHCYYLTEISLLDLSSCVYFSFAFEYCNHLVTIRFTDVTNSIEDMDSTFSGCTSLSNDSLNNIMQMCINATNYNSTKTLKYIGLTQAQAQTSQTLSNYQAFMDAGWTTGY